VLSYPPGQIGAVKLKYRDLVCLAGGPLNDSIIEFGLKLFLNDIAMANPQQAQYIHVFSPFFYTQLTKHGYEAVCKWTRRFNLFDKRFIFVPINKE
ncbi:hypothetical protein DFH07DRAFT_735960, partial [Mycena maculata]